VLVYKRLGEFVCRNLISKRPADHIALPLASIGEGVRDYSALPVKFVHRVETFAKPAERHEYFDDVGKVAKGSLSACSAFVSACHVSQLGRSGVSR
jgi:hypothetical protein